MSVSKFFHKFGSTHLSRIPLCAVTLKLSLHWNYLVERPRRRMKLIKTAKEGLNLDSNTQTQKCLQTFKHVKFKHVKFLLFFLLFCYCKIILFPHGKKAKIHVVVHDSCNTPSGNFGESFNIM